MKNLYDYNCDFLTSSCVSALFEDTKENCWVGTRGGLGVSRADGTSYKFGLMDFGDGLSTSWIYVRDIIEDIDHSIWLATGNMGLIHITGDINEPSSLKFRNYSYRSQKLQTNSVLCLHIDQSGNMWAGTEGGGLYLYSRKEKRFEEKNHEYNIPGDMVGCIEEDERGNLWLGTNAGLVKLSVKTNEKSPIVRVYTSADGLQDNFLLQILLVAGMVNSSLEGIRAITVFFLIIWRSTSMRCLSCLQILKYSTGLLVHCHRK